MDQAEMAARVPLQGSDRSRQYGEVDQGSTLDRRIESFGRWLKYSNVSDKTVTIYTDAARKLARFVTVPGWADLTAGHVQEFIIDVLETRSAGYANNLYRSLQQFFKWQA